EVHYGGVRKTLCGKYTAEIRDLSQRRSSWLGTFDMPEKAARAYAVVRLFRGYKVVTNFPEISFKTLKIFSRSLFLSMLVMIIIVPIISSRI
ncbi:Ethylene-responsive transcription factor 4, partial [Capsicum chinense]